MWYSPIDILDINPLERFSYQNSLKPDAKIKHYRKTFINGTKRQLCYIYNDINGITMKSPEYPKKINRWYRIDFDQYDLEIKYGSDLLRFRNIKCRSLADVASALIHIISLAELGCLDEHLLKVNEYTIARSRHMKERYAEKSKIS